MILLYICLFRSQQKSNCVYHFYSVHFNISLISYSVDGFTNQPRINNFKTHHRRPCRHFTQSQQTMLEELKRSNPNTVWKIIFHADIAGVSV